MKIAIITSTFPPYKGGMGNSAYEIAKILGVGNEITVFTPRPHPNPPFSKGRELKDEIKIEHIKPTWQIGNGAVLLELWKKLKDFDVIYLHYPFYGTAEIIWLYKLLHKKTKLIIHFHMDTPNLAWHIKILSWPLLLVKKNLIKRADKIISASLDYVAHSSIKDVWKKFPEKFVEIPFGVHLNKFHVFPHDIPELQELRKRYKINEKDRVVLFVGGLDAAHRFKGVDILLRSIAQNAKGQNPNYSKSNSNVKCLICGDGNKREEYEYLVKELKIEKQVIFAGRISDEELVLHYNLADIFVLPSIDKSEAFGMVLVEAMACGVPAMASNLPGVRSVFENGVQGYTVAPNSARHLRAKLEEYLKYPQRRWKMGRASRELVEERYDWEKIAEKFKEIFK